MSYLEIAFSIIGYLTFLLLVLAAIFSYNLFRFNKKEVSWLSIYLAMISLLIFQFFIFEETYKHDFFGIEKKPLYYVLFLVSSFMLAWGFWSMNKSFEKFEVFGEVARRKVKNFLDGLNKEEKPLKTEKSKLRK
ncbi:MAG: hypothetical protein QXZ13_03995 [Candidatus Diapherotrites archaeon]